MPSKHGALRFKPCWFHRKSACSLLPPLWPCLLTAQGIDDTVQVMAIRQPWTPSSRRDAGDDTISGFLAFNSRTWLQKETKLLRGAALIGAQVAGWSRVPSLCPHLLPHCCSQGISEQTGTRRVPSQNHQAHIYPMPFSFNCNYTDF